MLAISIVHVYKQRKHILFLCISIFESYIIHKKWLKCINKLLLSLITLHKKSMYVRWVRALDVALVSINQKSTSVVQRRYQWLIQKTNISLATWYRDDIKFIQLNDAFKAVFFLKKGMCIKIRRNRFTGPHRFQSYQFRAVWITIHFLKK